MRRQSPGLPSRKRGTFAVDPLSLERSHEISGDSALADAVDTFENDKLTSTLNAPSTHKLLACHQFRLVAKSVPQEISYAISTTCPQDSHRVVHRKSLRYNDLAFDMVFAPFYSLMALTPIP